MTDPAPIEISLSQEAMTAQLNEQAGKILNLEMLIKELVLQVQQRDVLLAEKAKATKRTTPKKKK